MTEPTTLDIAGAAAALASGEITASALTEAFLDRIDRLEDGLNCFVRITADAAEAAAAESDRRRRDGRALSPLDGISLAVKDNIDVAGVPTTNGTAEARMPDADSEVVRRLRAAGAVLLGKLNMHEGALGATTDNPHHGRTHNPWRTGFTPAGSSGGSGAAVAAHLCTAALGTDTLGSVRLPAAFCGVVGLLPSTGRVSPRGVAPLSPALDHVGPLGRTVSDAAILLRVLSGHDPEDPLSVAMPPPDPSPPADLAGLRLTTLDEAAAIALAPGVEAVYGAALDRLGSSGTALVRGDLGGVDLAATRLAGLLAVEADAAAAWGGRLDADPPTTSAGFRTLVAFGRDAPPEKLADARRLIDAAGRSLRRALGTDGLVVTPTVPQTAFAFDGPLPATQAIFTMLANYAGCPAISLPCGIAPDGLPVGLQLVAPPFAEARLLAAAAAVEAALPFAPLRLA